MLDLNHPVRVVNQVIGSFEKIDPVATFMRMKEDHMLNGRLKPGYNWQISTERQYTLEYTIHQTTNDTTTLQTHMELLKKIAIIGNICSEVLEK